MRKRMKKGTLFMAAGLLLIAAALVLAVYCQWDESRAQTVTETVLEQMTPIVETAREKAQQQGTADPGKLPDYVTIPDLEMPTVEIDGNLYIGELEIPSQGLTLPIMSQWSYPGLKIAPGRYQGSAYENNLIIAAHNYDCHFGPLMNLVAGDLIYFTDVSGNRFTYRVVDLEIVQPTAIEQMCTGDWDLTLFTCTYGGRTRFTVRCEAV